MGKKHYNYCGGEIMKRIEFASKIQGVHILAIPRHSDDRGWLMELFRQDELPFVPQMAYISQTEPGVLRGPHQHEEQTDYFVFIGPGNFELYLWSDALGGTSIPTNMETHLVGEDFPRAVIVPPGVIHAYKNVSDRPGVVFNAPDKLYGGPGKLYPVDEERWENRTMFMEAWFGQKESKSNLPPTK
jgi:dTDP-4-dehydrorhamnose 3,5-epimerase